MIEYAWDQPLGYTELIFNMSHHGQNTDLGMFPLDEVGFRMELTKTVSPLFFFLVSITKLYFCILVMNQLHCCSE